MIIAKATAVPSRTPDSIIDLSLLFDDNIHQKGILELTLLEFFKI